MKKKRFSEEQIIKALKRNEAGESPSDLCRELGIHQTTFFGWKRKFLFRFFVNQTFDASI